MRPAGWRASLALRDDADERLTVLARLFQAEDGVARRLAARAFAPATVDGLAEAGLVETAGATVRARFSLDELGGVFVASDHPGRHGRSQVIGVAGVPRTLAAMTVRRRVSKALDLCCGSGVQALLAARHATHVIAVDVNARCLRLARMNSALNGIDNIEWRRGDLFQPVEDQRFDLIVANPPFIVSPVQELLFRDGGRHGDGMSYEVVIGAARHLAEGGFATVMCNWITLPGQHWSHAPRRWLAGLRCDAWVIHFGADDPVTYAMRWNWRPGLRPAAVAALAKRWIADYRRTGVKAISSGAIVLRRRDAGRNWIQADDLLLGVNGNAGAHVERVFAAQDLLRSLARPGDLMEVVLVMAPGVRLVERRRSGGAVERARLTVGEGLRLPAPVPAAAIPVILNLDGRRSLGDAAAAAAASTGRPVEQLVKEVLRPIRALVGRGLLAPVRAPGRHVH